MKLILLQDIDNLGDEGEIVTVKPGYGRNYLIPQGKARMATPGAVKAWKEERKQASRKLEQKKEEAREQAREIENMEIVIAAKVGEENRIFGTVTSQQVAVELATRGVDVDRRNVEIDEDIRMIGVYSATIKVHPEVTAKLKIRVIPESGPLDI